MDSTVDCIRNHEGSRTNSAENIQRLSFAVRNKDVAVAHHILPHLVLNILISGKEEDVQGIRLELLAVLEDQVDVDSGSTADKKLLSAQVCLANKSNKPHKEKTIPF